MVRFACGGVPLPRSYDSHTAPTLPASSPQLSPAALVLFSTVDNLTAQLKAANDERAKRDAEIAALKQQLKDGVADTATVAARDEALKQVAELRASLGTATNKIVALEEEKSTTVARAQEELRDYVAKQAALEKKVADMETKQNELEQDDKEEEEARAKVMAEMSRIRENVERLESEKAALEAAGKAMKAGYEKESTRRKEELSKFKEDLQQYTEGLEAQLEQARTKASKLEAAVNEARNSELAAKASLAAQTRALEIDVENEKSKYARLVARHARMRSKFQAALEDEDDEDVDDSMARAGAAGGKRRFKPMAFSLNNSDNEEEEEEQEKKQAARGKKARAAAAAAEDDDEQEQTGAPKTDDELRAFLAHEVLRLSALQDEIKHVKKQLGMEVEQDEEVDDDEDDEEHDDEEEEEEDDAGAGGAADDEEDHAGAGGAAGGKRSGKSRKVRKAKVTDLPRFFALSKGIFSPMPDVFFGDLASDGHNMILEMQQPAADKSSCKKALERFIRKWGDNFKAPPLAENVGTACTFLSLLGFCAFPTLDGSAANPRDIKNVVLPHLQSVYETTVAVGKPLSHCHKLWGSFAMEPSADLINLVAPDVPDKDVLDENIVDMPVILIKNSKWGEPLNFWVSPFSNLQVWHGVFKGRTKMQRMVDLCLMTLPPNHTLALRVDCEFALPEDAPNVEVEVMAQTAGVRELAEGKLFVTEAYGSTSFYRKL